MTRYPNGSVPFNVLVELDSGKGKHWTTPASAVKWYALRAKVKREKGVTLKITDGWNAFRPLIEQHAARAYACNQGNCLGAAEPGKSSHGSTWAGPATGWAWVDAMAFDVGNYWEVPWEYFKAACKAVGLLADGIPLSMSGGVSERHHIIDLNPWGAVPAGFGAVEFITGTTIQEDDMIFIEDKDGKRGRAVAIGDKWVPLVNGTELALVSGNATVKLYLSTAEFDTLKNIFGRAARAVTFTESQKAELAAQVAAAIPSGAVSAEAIAEALQGVEFTTTVAG